MTIILITVTKQWCTVDWETYNIMCTQGWKSLLGCWCKLDWSLCHLGQRVLFSFLGHGDRRQTRVNESEASCRCLWTSLKWIYSLSLSVKNVCVYVCVCDLLYILFFISLDILPRCVRNTGCFYVTTLSLAVKTCVCVCVCVYVICFISYFSFLFRYIAKMCA